MFVLTECRRNYTSGAVTQQTLYCAQGISKRFQYYLKELCIFNLCSGNSYQSQIDNLMLVCGLFNFLIFQSFKICFCYPIRTHQTKFSQSFLPSCYFRLVCDQIGVIVNLYLDLLLEQRYITGLLHYYECQTCGDRLNVL